MERKYYEINEAAARRSKEMMSFDDYREGSATSAYRQEAEQIDSQTPLRKRRN